MNRVSPRAVAAVSFVAMSMLAAGVSCSLGLDASLIDKAQDAGAVSLDGASPDADSGDGRINTGIPDGRGAAPCTSDDACKTNHGCLKGKCDLTRKSCTYDVCRPSACNVATCDVQGRTCGGTATPYKFKSTQFTLGSKIACPRCAAAVHPWLFVVTVSGLVAFDMSNPGSPSPPQVPVVGLGFVPVALVQSGSRVWMLGGVSGEGPSRLQLAFVDAPADPFTTKITAQTVLASYNRKAEATSFFARAGDSALLVSQGSPFPAAFVEAPLAEPLSLSASPVVAMQNYGPSAVSGKRLLMSAVVNQAASFYLVDNAGTATPTSGPVTNLTSAGTVSTQRAFAQSADGTVFWVTGAHQGSGLATSTRAARGYFLVPGEAGPIDGMDGVDIEVYNPPAIANAPIFGGNQAAVAMLDSKTAMVAAQARDGDKQTVVQFVSREPLAVVKDANGTAPRRQVLPVRIGDVYASTGSNGVGYLLANDNDDGPGAATTVYVFDPACAP